MKKHLKILLIISLFINLVFVISIFIPKYYYIGSDFVGLDFKQIKSGGFVKGLNFEDIGGEFYIIFNGKSEYTDK
jgi:hypothetical protein